MTWDVDLVLMLRILINDMTLPYTYTDEYLKQVIVVAGFQVDAEFPFPYDYTYDLTNLTITPDPLVVIDASFAALVPLKAACIINQGEFKQALAQGIKVRDGDSAIDTSVSFRGYRDILEIGPCASYERLKWSLLASGAATSGGVGKAVLGPYRTSGTSGLSTISWYYDQFATGKIGRTDRS